MTSFIIALILVQLTILISFFLAPTMWRNKGAQPFRLFCLALFLALLQGAHQEWNGEPPFQDWTSWLYCILWLISALAVAVAYPSQNKNSSNN